MTAAWLGYTGASDEPPASLLIRALGVVVLLFGALSVALTVYQLPAGRKLRPTGSGLAQLGTGLGMILIGVTFVRPGAYGSTGAAVLSVVALGFVVPSTIYLIRNRPRAGGKSS